jgi:hypothetical protein
MAGNLTHAFFVFASSWSCFVLPQEIYEVVLGFGSQRPRAPLLRVFVSSCLRVFVAQEIYEEITVFFVISSEGQASLQRAVSWRECRLQVLRTALSHAR